MSKQFKLATTATRGKGVSEMTYEQVSDSDNYGKRSVKPLPMIVDGLAVSESETPKAVVSLVMKPKTKIPSTIGPLDNVEDHTEIPQPVLVLKLKSYNHTH